MLFVGVGREQILRTPTQLCIDSPDCNEGPILDSQPYRTENIFSYPVDVSNAPEPSTYAMMLAGLGLLGFMARRGKQKAG